MSKKISCYRIPVEFGDHTIYLLHTDSEDQADKYIGKKIKTQIQKEPGRESAAYFIGYMDHLYLFFPPKTPLEYLVHEITHMYRYMVDRMNTLQDEEGEAFIKQMLFKKIVDRLIKVNKLSIIYK